MTRVEELVLMSKIDKYCQKKKKTKYTFIALLFICDVKNVIQIVS